MPLTPEQQNRLADLYSEATQAGDTAAAEEYRQALIADDAPAEHPLPTRLGPRVSGRPMTPEDLALAAQGGRDIVAGTIEGLGPRLVGAAKQAAGGLSDFFGALWSGKPYRGADVRMPDGTIVRAGELETSAHNKATATEILRRVNKKQEWIESGRVNPEGASMIAAGAEQLPFAVAPEMVGPRATTMIGAAGRNALTGGAGAALQFDAEGNSNTDVMLGAGLGLGAGAAFAVIPAAKNAVGRALTAAANNPRIKSALTAARRTMKNTDFSLAQITQIPQMIALERAAYDSVGVEFYANQTDNATKDFVIAMSEDLPAGNLTESFVKTRQSLAKAIKSVHDNASRGYDEGMAEAVRMSDRVQAPQGAPGQRQPETFTQGPPAKQDAFTAFRGKRTYGGTDAAGTPTGAQIKVDGFRSQAQAVFDDARRAQPSGGKPLNQAWMNQMEQKLAKGYLTPREFADVMKDITKLQKGEGPGKAYGFKLRQAIENDLDMMEQNAGGAVDDVTKQIIETRQEYKRAMNLAAAMQDSAGYKLMGVKSDGMDDVTPDQLLERFKAMNPERQLDVRDFLKDMNPDMLDAMKGEAIRDVVRRAAGPLQPAADSRFSFEALDKALFDSERGVFHTQGLWSSKELEKLDDIRDGLRIITAERPTLKGPGTVLKTEDMAINAVAQHSGFVARQMTRILMSSKANKFFTDPKMQAILMKASRTTTGTPSNMLARAALLEWLQDECGAECYEQSVK